ncbi:hypothetical protein Patl1_35147 [Pistacia atlantica]|uniref:Uncharacterized protein n=1 Tax=Pistacia atlantica TaxID=434234 RepID=A0ACC0ZW29_9ROSI|nr:hypothetical protein Patl1_35147 [Pistacia atlantica]
MNSSILAAILLLSLLSFAVESRKLDHEDDKSSINGTRWAVLIAGSSGYGNYRHQADVCHAYQSLKSGGLKEENIIVFMYDDIAFAKENPRPGIIINKPYGTDVYYGVPKDYTGENVTANNFLAVILGNKTALTGGSGKVVNSGPNDHIFIYYTDHGSPGIIGMPSGYLYAKDLIDVLQKKHEAKAYKKMVIYVEACESGSVFEGLLPKTWNIYAMTAANSSESSWAIYCPEHYPYPPPEYDTCLGDLFSISWLEDSSIRHLKGSKEKVEAQKQLNEEISQRQREDLNIQRITTMLFGPKNGPNMVQFVRPAGQPLVDDWDCLKMLVGLYEEHCGTLSTYGKKYARAMANMCNAGVNNEKMIMALTQVCKTN